MNLKAMAVVASGVVASIASGDAIQWRVQDGGNGHWYELRSDPLIWTAARVEAQTMGGDLVALETVAELEWVRSRVPAAYFLAGGVQDPNASQVGSGWRWVTGIAIEGFSVSFDDNPCGASGSMMEDGQQDYVEIVGAVIGDINAGRQPNCSDVGARQFIVEWSSDCNNDGIVDYGQILDGTFADVNHNGTPDCCEASIVCWSNGASGCPPGATPIGVAQLAAGYDHGAARMQDGSVIAWGYNGYGQCDVPADLGPAVQIATGDRFTMALTTAGTVRCWGFNEHGQCNVPGSLGTVRAIAAGGNHAIAVLPDGSLRCWGRNSDGECNVPPSLPPVLSVEGGVYHTACVVTDGTVRCWGLDDFGQSTPTPSLTGVVAVSGGDRHTVALRGDGTVLCWGQNTFGQCAPPQDLEPIVAISASDRYTLALTATGFVHRWGQVQGAIPADLRSVKVIAAGASFGVAASAACAEQPPYLVPSQYPTIQAAIDAVPTNAQRTIQVAAGTYHESFSLNGKNIVIRGAPNNATILDGTGLTRSIARFTGGEPATAGVEGLVFRNGTAGSRLTPRSTFTAGGAILADTTAAHIKDCRFENCRADFGGAIYQYVGSLAWTNCVFTGNIANAEGGAALTHNCTGLVHGCSFMANRSGVIGPGSGSAFKSIGSNGDGETIVLDSCMVTGNIAGGSGSALEHYEHTKFHPGVLRIVNTTVSGNISGQPTPMGAAGLRVIGRMQSCIVAAGSSICDNTPLQVAGPYFIEGSVTVCDCAGDITGDGAVNGGDLGVLLANWGVTAPSGLADVTHDGLVDGSDLSVVLSTWGACP